MEKLELKVCTNKEGFGLILVFKNQNDGLNPVLAKSKDLEAKILGRIQATVLFVFQTNNLLKKEGKTLL